MHEQSPISRPQSGFSLIEVLIAAFILLIIALGLMPIFTRSISMNLSGNDSTQLSNIARSSLEELVQLDFNSAPLTITAGTELVTVQYWQASSKSWQNGPAPRSADAPWERTIRVRQFGMSDLQDVNEDGEFDSPRDASAGPTDIHAKEVQVRVESNRALGNPLSRPRPITLRTLVSY